MTPRAIALAAACLVLATLGSPSIAAAGDVGWNPFLFIFSCSSCGPLTPLSMEQADGGQVLPGGLTFGGEDVESGTPNAEVPIPTDGANAPGNAPGFANANGLAVGGGLGIGATVSVEGGNGNGLNYGLTLTNSSTGAINSGGQGPDAPNDDVVAFSFVSPTGDVGDTATNLSVTQLSPTDGGGSGSGQTLVPEPTSMLLFGSGLAVVGALARRKKRVV
jgi:hypothetical protein